MVKGLQKEKQQRRQVVHKAGDLSGLLEDLGPGQKLNDKFVLADILPVEYGGSNGSLEELTSYWRQEVEGASEWLTLQVHCTAALQ